MNILLYTRYRVYMDWLPNFMRFFQARGCRVFHVSGRKALPFAFRKLVPHMDHVFVWNGNREHERTLVSLCVKWQIPHSFLESGFFPQKNYYTLDRRGVNAKSELMEDDLSWVSDVHIRSLEQMRSAYIGSKRHRGSGEYVLAPLQLEKDSVIVLHSPFKTMQAFIEHVEEKFPDRKIIFKTHPKDENAKSYRVSAKNALVHQGNFLEMVIDASLVYGINSTTLLEAALLGAPVVATGDGFLKQHAHQVEKLLAAVVDMQIPIEEKDISYWLEKYTDFSWKVQKKSFFVTVKNELYSLLFQILRKFR